MLFTNPFEIVKRLQGSRGLTRYIQTEIVFGSCGGTFCCFRLGRFSRLHTSPFRPLGLVTTPSIAERFPAPSQFGLIGQDPLSSSGFFLSRRRQFSHEPAPFGLERRYFGVD